MRGGGVGWVLAGARDRWVGAHNHGFIWLSAVGTVQQGMADSNQAIKNSTILQPSGGKQVNTIRCYAANTILAGMTEMFLVLGFNTELATLLAAGTLQKRRPDLVDLARNTTFEHK